MNAHLVGGFDSDAKAIVRAALANGWTARRSTKGHVIMRSPDGKTTQSVSQKLSKRNGARVNTLRAFRDFS